MIGRKGRTISAIRTIVYSVPTEDKKVRIVIDEKKKKDKVSPFFLQEEGMRDLTVRQLEEYLLDHYQQSRTEEGLFFIKLVEEVGEVAEVLNGRSGRKRGVKDSNEELAKELADIIHYTVAIAAINHIDLTKTILKKRQKKAAIKYQHEQDLEGFLAKEHLRKSFERDKIKPKNVK